MSQFVLGPLGDRLGARPMLTAMLAASALSTAAFATCTSPLLLMAAMAMNGVAQSAGYPLCMKVGVLVVLDAAVVAVAELTLLLLHVT